MPKGSSDQARMRAKQRRSAGQRVSTIGDEAEGDEQRNMVGLRLAHIDGESDSFFAFDPLTALILATVFISGVIVLHILAKFAR